MIRRISLLFAAALLVATMAVMTAVPLFASPGEDACLAQNDPPDTTATWGKDPDGGGWTCTVTTTEDTNPSGNDNPNAARPFETTTTDTETTSGQGGGGGQQTNPKHEDPPPDEGPTLNRGGNAPGGQNR